MLARDCSLHHCDGEDMKGRGMDQCERVSLNMVISAPLLTCKAIQSCQPVVLPLPALHRQDRWERMASFWDASFEH